ncbi:exonuclease domain-containing protein [Chryseobacterium foetidum]|uniref:exonuclease domain-containing protein n=1 Tax=Chryseobacterium foetidum TaxID=2951057 RepID=UPI0021C917E7|nr:exonuclease domain-containing protein [Chryseobacterium foetidum]
MRFTSIDFEKANNDSCSVCSIGIAVFENGSIIYSKNYLVQPPDNVYLALHSSIHGLTAEDTCNAPAFPEVWNVIRQYIKGETVVAHNGCTVEFPILESLFRFYGMTLPDYHGICTLQLSKQLFPYLNNHKLSTVAELFSLNFSENQHHNAQYDAEVCGFIFLKMNQFFKLNNRFMPDHKVKKESSKTDFFTNTFSFKKIDSSLIYPAEKPKYENHYFYSKKVVITGEFSAFPKQRNRLAQILFDCGADINTSISKNTDLVLVGTGAGPKKMEKISALSIAVMNEEELLGLIKDFING